MLRTAADVRAFLLGNWRKLLPDLLVPQARVGPSSFDPSFVEIDLQGEPGPVEKLLFVPVASGEPRLLRGLLPRLRELNQRPDTWAGLLVPHMGNAGQRLCREAGVGFIDCCGNAYLRFNRVIVQISGHRNRFSEPKRLRTVFHDKATIPLRILLDSPGTWLTTRDIAERGALSLGWVSQILQELDAQGYVERKRGGGTRLTRPERLLQDWLDQYAFEQNEVFPFRVRAAAIDATLARLRTLQAPFSERYALTLQAGFAALRGGTDASELHIYLPALQEAPEEALETWCNLLDLRPAGHGANCLLVRPAYLHGALYGARQASGLTIVSDLQLYLDLYHYPAAGRSRVQAAVAARLPFPVQ